MKDIRQRVSKLSRTQQTIGIVLAGVVVIALVSLLTHRSASIPTITVTAKDYSFTMPNTLPNGYVEVIFKNEGKQPHQANIVRLNQGVTKAKLQQTLQQNMDAALGMVTFVGGANIIDPGASQQVVLKLSAGTYVAICFVSDPNGKPHFMDGMISFFAVGNPSGSSPSAPSYSSTVTLKEFSIGVPAGLKAGTYTWLVKNVGTQPHEMALLKLTPGKSESDALAYLGQQQPSGAPPFGDAGGMGGLSPGGSAWVTVTLSKGTYVALCFVPDAHNGKPHFMEGMVAQFTIK
jgi:hypothetical protein